jgi:hypothetical protein
MKRDTSDTIFSLFCLVAFSVSMGFLFHTWAAGTATFFGIITAIVYGRGLSDK